LGLLHHEDRGLFTTTVVFSVQQEPHRDELRPAASGL